jgi:hypothetical protein
MDGTQIQGNVNSGSADNGGQHAGNADLLNSAFAGAEGAKPDAKPGTGDAAAGGSNAGSGETKTDKPTVQPWMEQLTPETRNNRQHAEKLAKFAKVGDLAQAYLELEGKTGVTLPAQDAAPEAVAEFWGRLGKPKAAEGYSFAADKNRQGEVFAQAAFAANLTEAQAAAMFKGLGETGERQAQALNEARQRQHTETVASLQKEYGSRYPEKMELLTRGLMTAGPNVANLLSQAGLSGNPEIVKAFIAFGEMTAESGGAKGGNAGGQSMKPLSEGGSLDYKT